MQITWEIFGGRFVGRVVVEDSVIAGSGAGWEGCKSSAGGDEAGIDNKFPSFLFQMSRRSIRPSSLSFFNIAHLF